MTTQLWMWKYNGQDEVGIKSAVDKQELFRTDDFYSLATPHSRRTIGQVTNLRPAKVVDEDAVVLDPKLFLRAQFQLGTTTENRKMIIFPDETADEIWKQLFPSPQVQEPKIYLTTDQFIKVWQSLDDAKIKQLYAAWYAARSAAWYAARYAAWYAAWSAAWDAAWSAARYAAWYADLAILAKDAITAEQFEILTSPWTSCGLSLYAEDWDEVLNSKVTEPTGFAAVVEAKCRFIIDGKSRFQFVRHADGSWYANVAHTNNTRQVWSDLINPEVISEGVRN